MDIILCIVVLFGLIGVGVLLCETIKALFSNAKVSTGRSSRNHSEDKFPSSLKLLPEPSDAHDMLEAFCRIMHKIDVEMSPYCQYEGKALLMGGIDSDGKGYVYFWYDKDHAAVGSVFPDIGYYSPSESISASTTISGSNTGWTTDDGKILYQSRTITGYLEWTGYFTTYKNYGRDRAENSMRSMITAVLQNEWPEARITSYDGHFDTPRGQQVAYLIEVKTTIGDYTNIKESLNPVIPDRKTGLVNKRRRKRHLFTSFIIVLCIVAAIFYLMPGSFENVVAYIVNTVQGAVEDASEEGIGAVVEASEEGIGAVVDVSEVGE